MNDDGNPMTAYHGTTRGGLSSLKPFANPDSNLDYACVYLTSYKPLAALYIWDKPYKWLNYGFADDGIPVYTESFANAKIKVAVVSRREVPVKGADFVSDCYTRILDYERQGLLRINRFGTLSDAKRASERKMILSVIERENLLQNESAMARFVREKFPEIWKEAKAK